MRTSRLSENDLHARIGQRLRAARIAAGLTPLQVIEASGVSRSIYYLYETGDASFKVAILDRIAAAIGCTLSDLLATDEEEEQRRQAHERLQQALMYFQQTSLADRFAASQGAQVRVCEPE